LSLIDISRTHVYLTASTSRAIQTRSGGWFIIGSAIIDLWCCSYVVVVINGDLLYQKEQTTRRMVIGGALSSICCISGDNAAAACARKKNAPASALHRGQWIGKARTAASRAIRAYWRSSEWTSGRASSAAAGSMREKIFAFGKHLTNNARNILRALQQCGISLRRCTRCAASAAALRIYHKQKARGSFSWDARLSFRRDAHSEDGNGQLAGIARKQRSGKSRTHTRASLAFLCRGHHRGGRFSSMADNIMACAWRK